MFHIKNRTEKLTEQFQDQSESLAETAASLAYQLRERVVPAVGQATENARVWAKPRFEHGIEVAAPRLESAVHGLAPHVDTARDKIVDDLIPRVSEAISAWAAATAAAKDEAVSRGQGAAAVISGDAVAAPKGRMKRLLFAAGMVTAAAGAAMAFMKRSAPKDDPWTTPLADPYVPTPNGRHSAAAPVVEVNATTRTQTEIIDSLDENGLPSPTDPSGTDLGAMDSTDSTASTASTDKSGDQKKSATNKNPTDKGPRA